MFTKIFRYFFPPLRPDQKLPLLPRQYSSDHQAPGQRLGSAELRYLKAKSAARTDADAQRLINRHGNKPVRHVAAASRRERRREGRISRAWRKLKDLGK